MSGAVPAYEPMLAAYHREFATELRAMVATLPIAPGQTVLDMACGDGVYSGLLAERVGAGGRVLAVDARPEYLELARRQAGALPCAAMIDSLPFAEGSVDLCWCAQSLFSLPDPLAAVRRMVAVTKQGGFVTVLEDDTVHQVLLPWPAEMELAVRAAEFRALEGADKYYVGRRLRAVFREAGLEAVEIRTFATDRAAPLGADARLWLAEYLKALSGRVAALLDASVRARFERLTASMPDDPDLTVTVIDRVARGRRPLQPRR